MWPGLQVAQSLVFLHAGEAAHLDVKPANVLIAGGVAKGQWVQPEASANRSFCMTVVKIHYSHTSPSLPPRSFIVADLGVAKVYQKATASGHVLSTSRHDPRGTPLYMDPAPIVDDEATFGPVSSVIKLGLCY